MTCLNWENDSVCVCLKCNFTNHQFSVSYTLKCTIPFHFHHRFISETSQCHKINYVRSQTNDSMRAVSPDSVNDLDPNSKIKPVTGTGSSVAVDSKKKSEEGKSKQ